MNCDEQLDDILSEEEVLLAIERINDYVASNENELKEEVEELLKEEEETVLEELLEEKKEKKKRKKRKQESPAAFSQTFVNAFESLLESYIQVRF